jgi:hypothetical protein
MFFFFILLIQKLTNFLLFRESLAFATEPCFCSLANALGNHENMPTPLPDDLVNFKLLEVEIKYGLMQVSNEYNDRVVTIKNNI